MQNNCSEGNGRQRKCPGGLSHFKLNSKEQMNGECKGRERKRGEGKEGKEDVRYEKEGSDKNK